MGLPRAKEAKLFYRAALQRLGDARFLLDENRNTGAVYLAGYTVECLLKALILESVAAKLRVELLDGFRGARAHRLEWLHDLYVKHVRIAIPVEISRELARVTSWTTDLRYETGTWPRREAEDFMKSVNVIYKWADGRM